ncbi:MAG: hypothetical protein V2I65_17580 [Paracoccaceae bacterium]|nr:hypothetical protein [Paracoccaceae bacterium]
MTEERANSLPEQHDDGQPMARARGAACTPDSVSFDAGLGLRDRGWLDGVRSPPPASALRDRSETMLGGRGRQWTGTGTAERIPSTCCSIKWKAA